MSSINYIVSILKDAGFTKAQIKPATPSHINKLFADYLNSCEWSEEWFFSINPSQLDGEQLKLYDSAKELYDTPDEVLSDTEDMMITLGLQLGVAECEDKALLVKFSEFYALCVYYHTMKHLHSIDIWANGDAHVVYANRYSKALLHHYGYDDEYLIDTSFEKDFSDVVKQLVHDPYDLWVIAHMTSKLVRDLRDELNEALWYNPYKAQLIENYTKYVPVPSGSSQYVIACDVEVVEPTLVHHDVKLDDVELPVIVPQEVVSEPQEELSTTTQINGDDVMNNNTVWLDWSISTPCLKAWELDFGTYVPVVESEPVVEVVKPHYSDKWFGQCCDLNDNPEFTQWDIVRTGKPYFPEVVEFTPLPSKAPSIMNIGRGKVYFPTVLTPEQLDDAKAKIQATVIKAERKASLASPVRCGSPVVNTPTITTKSGKVVQVSPHCVTPYGNAPVSSRVTSPKVTSAIGEASAVDPVDEYKSTLFNLNDYDITRNIVVDVATTTPATPKAPKPSTATFASNFNSLVMAKYRELNNGIIKDSLVLNKLTSALRANNSEAYTALVTTFGNPTAVALHRQAYDAVVSAS